MPSTQCWKQENEKPNTTQSHLLRPKAGRGIQTNTRFLWSLEVEGQSLVCPHAFLVWGMHHCQEEPFHILQRRGIYPHWLECGINMEGSSQGKSGHNWGNRGHALEEVTPSHEGKGDTTRSLGLPPSLGSGLEFLEHCPERTSARLKTPLGTLILQRTLKIQTNSFEFLR